VFDPKLLLANVGAGKAIFKFRKNKDAFEQGDVADTVFYIQQGKVNLAVLSDPRGRKRRRDSRERRVLLQGLLE
jgi:CRP-like cAMP-binding protein